MAQCQHDGCTCKVDNGKYCSEHCERSKASSRCGCGHPGCGDNAPSAS